MTRSGRIEDTVAAIRTTNWDEILPHQVKNFIFGNEQEAFDRFYAVILAAQDTYQPLKVAKKRVDEPWMTPHLKKMIQQRQRNYFK